LMAARAGKRVVMMIDFEAAKDKVMMGAERRSMVMTEEEKRLTAYHEAGHAIVAWVMPSSDPIHKATIIPRGRALGLVQQLPERDRLSLTREWLTSRIAVAMAGRVAEELIFGHERVTNGAASDIQQATKIARHMVTQWGMSDSLGPVGYDENTQEVFLGHSVTQSKNVSESTAQQIDTEIRRLISEGLEKARQILTERLDTLHTMASALLEHETLSGDDIGALMRGEPLPEIKKQHFDVARPGSGPSGKRGSVPATRPVDGDTGGIEPTPQPGT
jgi:cell division protease FtsH